MVVGDAAGKGDCADLAPGAHLAAAGDPVEKGDLVPQQQECGGAVMDLPVVVHVFYISIGGFPI